MGPKANLNLSLAEDLQVLMDMFHMRRLASYVFRHKVVSGFYLGGGTLGMVPPLSRKVPPQNKNMQA